MNRKSGAASGAAVLFLTGLLAGCGASAPTASPAGAAASSTTGSATTPGASAAPTGQVSGGAATTTTKSACAIASTAEVSALAGHHVTRQPPPSASPLAGTSNCIYQAASGGTIAILVDSRSDGSAIIQGAEQQGGKAVSGIGDSAALSHQGSSIVAINAARGGVLVSVSVAGIAVADGAIEAFARMLIGRL